MRNAELHAAVLAAPDDDAPREVYADWLAQHGDPRGEMIAVALARSRCGPGDPRARELAERERELWAAHGEEWNARYGIHAVTYRNGFVERVRCTGALFEDPGVLDDACVRVAVLDQGYRSDANRELARCLAALSGMPLRELSIGANAMTDEAASVLAAMGAIEQLELRATLHIMHAYALAAPSALPQLRALSILQRNEDAPAIAGIFAKRERPLDELRLDHSFLARGGVADHVDGPGYARLRALSLIGTGIGEVDVDAIVRSTMPLVRLGLSNNLLGAGSAALIAATPRFATLESLELAHTEIGQAGIDALIASPHLPRTLELALEGEHLGLERDVWYDQGVAIGASWLGAPRGRVTERFRVRVEGGPGW